MTRGVMQRHSARLSRIRSIQQRRRALAISLLVHGMALSAVAVLSERTLAPPEPQEAAVALVFATPSPPEKEAPAIQTLPSAPEPPPEPKHEPAPEASVPLPAPPQPNTEQEAESPKLPAPAMSQHRVQARPTAQPSRPAVALPAAPAAAEHASAAALIPARPLAGMETDRPPTYPELARRRGEQGRVLLQVAVSADGLPLNVTVAQSSGFPSLDTAAVNAVEKWRFIPATQAGARVAATAEVPVRFRLVD